MVRILNDSYEKLDLKRTINAATSLTTLGGSMPDPRVFEAMQDASHGFIHIPLLQKAVGERIAKLLGGESSLPTAGAVNALMLSVAACMFKGTELEDHDPLGDSSWVKIIQRLPMHTNDLRNEFIILGDSRSEYDHAIECAGGKRIVAGSSEIVTVQDLKNVYNEDKTAALYYTITPTAKMSIQEFCDVAHQLGVPAIVDAAPFLTHREVPRRILEQGADLRIFSGGKQLGCINNTGILMGKKGLIKLAHLNAYPFDGIGRGCKMSRETIMGLLTTVEIFADEDRNEYYKVMRKKTEAFAKRLADISGIKSGTLSEPGLLDDAICPSYAWIEMETETITLRSLYEKMFHGTPKIKALYEPFFLTKEAGNRITLKVEYLLPGDDDLIIDRITEIMTQAPSSGVQS